jgi:hypothetical protein
MSYIRCKYMMHKRKLLRYGGKVRVHPKGISLGVHCNDIMAEAHRFRHACPTLPAGGWPRWSNPTLPGLIDACRPLPLDERKERLARLVDRRLAGIGRSMSSAINVAIERSSTSSICPATGPWPRWADAWCARSAGHRVRM